MNDEIKEILDNTLEYLEGIDETRNTKILTTNETNILLDYITNLQQDTEMYAQLKDEYEEEIKDLQQENERLKELNAELKAITKRPTPIDYAMIQKRYEDYKSRCEKAIEYIRSNEWAKDYEISNCRTHLLNILQNGSESNG